MPQNYTDGTSRIECSTSMVGRIIPVLWYEDVAAAVAWLTTTFGFRERLRRPAPDGTLTHAELEIGDGALMVSDQRAGPDFDGKIYQNPNRTGHVSLILHVNVDNVDKHFERAKKAGATILSEPEDKVYGDRSYRVKDLEGHRWEFAQHIRDVAPEDWGAVRV